MLRWTCLDVNAKMDTNDGHIFSFIENSTGKKFRQALAVNDFLL